MQTLITIIHILTCVFLILAVLLQAGRGGGLGAGLSGAGTQMFGGQGAAPFLVKVTTVLAALFFLTSLTLAALGTSNKSVLLKEATPVAAEEVKPGENTDVNAAPVEKTTDAVAPDAPVQQPQDSAVPVAPAAEPAQPAEQPKAP